MFWDLPRFGKSGPAFRLVRIRPSLQRPWQDLQPEAAGNWLYKGSNLCIISYSSRSASTKSGLPGGLLILGLDDPGGYPGHHRLRGTSAMTTARRPPQPRGPPDPLRMTALAPMSIIFDDYRRCAGGLNDPRPEPRRPPRGSFCPRWPPPRTAPMSIMVPCPTTAPDV